VPADAGETSIMGTDWKDNQFRLAINKAGAVSAGAYTAGVLDFLMEAIE